ncbi:hypothetical protein QTF07_001499 [Campylobacter jejuni]|nr:hypothetical protein [Campylobacter jejuni]
MSDDVLYLVFIIVLLIAMLAYMNIKERENNAKIAKLQNVIEDITKELHYFRKELGVKDDSKEDEDYKTSLLKEEIMIELDKQISSKITPVLRTLKTMEHIIEDFQNEQQNRLLNLEQKIENLFKEGKSIEQIAKDLRIGTGNVELVLKFKKLIK